MTIIRHSAQARDPAAVVSGGPMHTLSLSNITKTYGKVVATDAISLDVPRGEFLTLLGPSGSGKTTLLMIIAGFVEPTTGELYLSDRPVTHLPPEKRNFGMVFQGYALFPHMTVAENVGFPLRVRRVAKSEAERRVAAVLQLVQLSGLEDRPPQKLSGGQQQRVALARALVFEPDILLLDEPLGALDKKLRAEMQIELKQLHERVGTTFIYVTHDQEEALSMSDRIAIIRDGRFVQIGGPADLYERPASRFVADFLGESNFLSGQVEGVDGLDIAYRVGKERFIQVADGAAAVVGENILVALRPEKIALSTDAQDGIDNRITGEIHNWNYYGTAMHITVRTEAAGDIAVSHPAWRAAIEPDRGLRVWLSWPRDATVVVADD